MEPVLELAAELVVVAVNVEHQQIAVKQRVAVRNTVMCCRIIGAYHVQLTCEATAAAAVVLCFLACLDCRLELGDKRLCQQMLAVGPVWEENRRTVGIAEGRN